MLVDNSGFVHVYKRRGSRCPYTYTVAKAVYDVARGLGCKVTVSKTPRCAGPMEEIADALSKGDWKRAFPLMEERKTEPCWLPRTIMKWLIEPEPDMELGMKILDELVGKTKVLHFLGARY